MESCPTVTRIKVILEVDDHIYNKEIFEPSTSSLNYVAVLEALTRLVRSRCYVLFLCYFKMYQHCDVIRCLS